jgi:hypothetical protein
MTGDVESPMGGDYLDKASAPGKTCHMAFSGNQFCPARTPNFIETSWESFVFVGTSLGWGGDLPQSIF